MPTWLVLRHIWLSLIFVLVTAASIAAQHVWLDADGKALPFQTDEEITEFMRTANVVDEEPIGVGINQSVRVTLEQNGVRAHAIFREVDRREDTAVIQGTHYRYFADSYLFEPAAFELAKMLDIPHVPPAALRTLGRRRGSLQLWVEDVIDEDEDGFRPPNAIAWASQLWDMQFFDNIIYNIDRNPGNLIVSHDYKLWLIDHTRGFQFKYELLNDDVVRVRRSSYERLLALTQDGLETALNSYLEPLEMASILERRNAMKAYVEKLVLERGESAVFY